MKEALKFENVVDQTSLAKWRTFADSFVHGSDTPILPLTMVSRGDKLFGYWSTFLQPIIFPSYHPEFTTPRDFKDMTEAFTNITCHNSISQRYPNGVCHVGLVTNGLPVGRHYVEKLGYENLQTELHRHLP